jgi:hypothetical protein
MPDVRQEAGGVSVDDKKFSCSICGGHFELKSKHGRTAAKYGMCPKCMSEEVMATYHNMKFGWEKIKSTIPFLMVLLGYRHYYGKKEVVQ